MPELWIVVNLGGKSTECYLGLLYAMEDVAVYGYITPLKVKIVVALALSDSVVRDAEVILVSSPIISSGEGLNDGTRFSRLYTWRIILPYRILS